MDINITNPVTTSKIGEVVNGASAATPNDTDLLPVVESSVTKKITLTNLKAFLKTYFDTLYSNLGYTAENVANKSDSYTLSSSTTYASTKAVVDGLATKEPLKGTDDNYVTDAQLVVISNTSGTNTGDNATNTTSNSYADGKVAQTITNGVTTSAPSQDVVFDALALKVNYFSLSSFSTVAGHNPSDGATYYTGGIIYVNTSTAAFRRLYIPYNCTLISASVTFLNVGLGTSENSSIYARLNNNTDTLISSTIDNSIQVANYLNSSLNLSLSQGDYIEGKWVCPIWVTNPTSVIYRIDWTFKI